MKQLAMLAVAFVFCVTASNAATITQTELAGTPDYVQTKIFVTMSVSEFEIATGKKLGLFQKIYFKKLQRKLARSNYDEEATILDHYDVKKQKFKFDPLWFVIGTLIGPFGLLFSYTADSPNRNKHISAAIGFGVFIIWFGLIFLF